MKTEVFRGDPLHCYHHLLLQEMPPVSEGKAMTMMKKTV